MAVPAFDSRGFLPPYIGQDGTTADRSPYSATMTEVVATLGSTRERRELIKGLLGYRTLLERLGYVDGLQFVDGTFAENVEAKEGRPPGDIDVFSFLMRPDHYRLDYSLWTSTGFPEWRNEIVNQPLNKQRFRLDTYAIAIDQAGPLSTILETTYWYSLFRTNELLMIGKDFLELR
jgi:hypothetical protein